MEGEFYIRFNITAKYGQTLDYLHLSRKFCSHIKVDANIACRCKFNTSHVETRAKSDLNKQEYLLFYVNCQKLTI